jgi:hypothetical protein
MPNSRIVKLAGNRVERVRTDVSEPQMAQAIISAWQQKFGGAPSKEQVAMVLAQNDLETGHRKSMWNYNVGNITTGANGTFDYFDDLATDEQISPGVWKKMNLKYRAYPTLDAGVKDYLNLLSSGRYTKAWEHIKNPDPTSFSKALKEAGYYTANEAPYTKNLVSLFAKNSKSNSYELAMAGKVNPPDPKGTTTMVAQKDGPSDKDDVFKQYLSRIKGKEMDIYQELADKKKPAVPASSSPAPAQMNSVLDNYLQMIAASEKTNRKLYKKYLPSNNAVIRIASINYVDAVEFARVLCSVLDEELVARAFTHTDGKNVEVECIIPGPAEICFEAVEQLTFATKEAFKKATTKIGGIEIKTKLVTNKKSHRDQIDLKVAETQHRKFLLKFI